jgi:hypothetical protein
MNKELKHLIHSKIIQRPLGIENRLVFLENKIEKSINSGKKRFEKLLKEIDEKYPPKSVTRGSFDGITAIVFDTAFELYFIGNNSALFVELQGLLERFCFNALTDLLPVNDVAKEIVIDSYEKKTLRDFAPYFKTLGLWNDSEVKFALKLTTIRNGIAHKNGQLVSKHLFDGKQSHPESIHEITSKVDCIPYILSSIELIAKASQAATPAFIKNPRFKARIEKYSSIIGSINNMFCYREFINLPRDIKEVSINDIFAPVMLIGCKELGEKLTKYKIELFDFHNNINQDDEKAKKSYEKLGELAKSIFELMRTDLNIDGDASIFKEPKLIDLKEIKKEKEKLATTKAKKS